MPESYKDQLSRVEQMIEDDGDTWDLSPNDKAALSAVLQDAKRYAALKSVSHSHAPTMRDGRTSFGVAIPGLFTSFDAAVDSLSEKGE